KQNEFLTDPRKNTIELKRSPGDSQHRRRMQIRIDRHQVHNAIRQIAHVALGQIGAVPGIKEQFHLERSEIAVNELKKRSRQSGNVLGGEIVILIDRVFFRVEERENTL